MRYKANDTENQEIVSIREPLKTVLEGLGFSLVELTVSRHRGTVQVRVVIYNGTSIGTFDCTRVHRAVMPRLELEFSHADIYLEVSSAGIDRSIKTGEEFALYKGRGVRCYRTDISDWTAGILEDADENGIMIKTTEGIESLNFDVITKARLDSKHDSLQSYSSQEV
jgi:ribosome maturation factor RimP